ncbi:DNA-directed RNA polymerase subunit omega [Clostridia bacterium OttesenSCG-928-F22]|nr:DNA-directed RNA polymerase subunit omega [Clostridia bacterium OttesenSCG-928-F22]
MLYPSINKLMQGVDNRYALVILTSKRARQIVDNAQVLTDNVASNPVTTAINEIYEKKITVQEALVTDEQE